MTIFNQSDLKKLYVPSKSSHKGQNGKVTIVGGSSLFHGASLWALRVASRIVDMVFYASVPENNALTQQLKGELYDFIAVPRQKMEEYIAESDVVLIGPGLPREDGKEENEESTKELTKRLLEKFPRKKWVIDAGSLQMMEAEWIKSLKGNVVITPHRGEFETLFSAVIARSEATRQSKKIATPRQGGARDDIQKIAREYNCTILLKGPTDIVCSPSECVAIEGGNEGMTKGGTGDVLAGLVAALACKNDLFLAAAASSFINKKAGESLYKRVGPYFNASDLADEIPKVMKSTIF